MCCIYKLAGAVFPLLLFLLFFPFPPRSLERSCTAPPGRRSASPFISGLLRLVAAPAPGGPDAAAVAKGADGSFCYGLDGPVESVPVVRQLRHHFRTGFRPFSAPTPHTLSVYRGLLVVHTDLGADWCLESDVVANLGLKGYSLETMVFYGSGVNSAMKAFGGSPWQRALSLILCAPCGSLSQCWILRTGFGTFPQESHRCISPNKVTLPHCH